MYGIEHAGNQLSEKEEGWLKLVDRSIFHDACEPWIDSLANVDVSELRNDARSYALKKLDWNITVDVMEQLLVKN